MAAPESLMVYWQQVKYTPMPQAPNSMNPSACFRGIFRWPVTAQCTKKARQPKNARIRAHSRGGMPASRQYLLMRPMNDHRTAVITIHMVPISAWLEPG